MERKWTKNGMRQIVDSGLKIFDRQVQCLNWSGNVISNTQLCSYIRSYNDIECNRKTDYEPGYLQEWDMKTWGVGEECKKFIRGLHPDMECWWTKFSYNNSNGDYVRLGECVVIFGEVAFRNYPCNLTRKQMACFDFLTGYIKQGLEEERKKT